MRGSHRAVFQARLPLGARPREIRDKRETVIRSHLGFLVLSKARSHEMGRGHKLWTA